MPGAMPDFARSSLSDPLPQRDDLQTVSVLLGKLHEGTRWPIELFRSRGYVTAHTPVLQHSYILFLWNEVASNLNQTLENLVEDLELTVFEP